MTRYVKTCRHVVNQQLERARPAGGGGGGGDFAPVFSLLVVAVSKGNIDPSRVDLSLPFPHRKKPRRKESKEKKKEERTEKVLG